MAVIPWAGEALRGDRASLASGARLQSVKKPETHRLLEPGISLQLDVRTLPEVIEVAALASE